ncbi:hypothetical protein HPP92_006233 [Vanilla planifolia]|uniref:CHHC U11-48K-type domain-containing protein n=1 Tax=Vanilla planifolia TaxID=51239 RepID=A0A835VDD0_VANPL|nr:hypothetical protein HPP92_006233 [Vanilla planifolia]
MLKESFLQVGRSLLPFRIMKEQVANDDNITLRGSENCAMESELCPSKSAENMDAEGHKHSENFCIHKVFVSQVAAAVAALHERFILEQRLKALRFIQPLPKSERLNQYISIILRASKEREKRLNYRPLLEHDGLIWQRPKNQDFGRSKTREELLAEERDYKRRRMSYRGKKVKRNNMQVLHDIIEEHMEEIKQAGGIGCNVKSSSDSTFSPSINETLETRTKNSPHYVDCKSEKVHGYDSATDVSMISCMQKPLQKPTYERYEDQHNLKRSKSDMKRYRSKSPTYYSDNSRSREGHSYTKHQSIKRSSKEKLGVYDSHPRYRNHSNREIAASKYELDAKYDVHYVKEYRRNGNRSSERKLHQPTGQDVFDDRYQPSPSEDIYETDDDDLSEGSNYARSQKLHR